MKSKLVILSLMLFSSGCVNSSLELSLFKNRTQDTKIVKSQDLECSPKQELEGGGKLNATLPLGVK